jgi:tellurite resistance-related uncharacterized protein
MGRTVHKHGSVRFSRIDRTDRCIADALWQGMPIQINTPPEQRMNHQAMTDDNERAIQCGM